MNATRPQEPFESGDLAGEYVLGVLDASERRAAAERAAHDAAFAREIAAWERRLAPLASEIEPVQPPAYVWTRIRTALGHAPAESAEPLWERIGFWRWLTAGAFALATACVVALFVSRERPAMPAAPPLVAVMALDNGSPAFVATIDREHGTMIVTPVSSWSDAAHVPELWLIPPGDRAYSLGVVDTARPMTVAVPKALQSSLAAQPTVAISVEPPGGSPTGQATGPIIAKGSISGI